MDELTFKSLFNKAYVFCKQRLISLTGSPKDAKDLFVKASTKYWVKFQDKGLQSIENPEQYIYTIAKNMWYDKQKKKKNERPASDEDLTWYENKQHRNIDDEDFDDLVKKENEKILKEEQQKRKECLKRAFQKLKPKCRKLLTSALYYEKDNQELKDLMGYGSINVVKAVKYRCKEQLKKLYLIEYNQTTH